MTKLSILYVIAPSLVELASENGKKISDLLVDQLFHIINFVLLMEFRNLIEYVHAGNVIPKGY